MFGSCDCCCQPKTCKRLKINGFGWAINQIRFYCPFEHEHERYFKNINTRKHMKLHNQLLLCCQSLQPTICRLIFFSYSCDMLILVDDAQCNVYMAHYAAQQVKYSRQRTFSVSMQYIHVSILYILIHIYINSKSIAITRGLHCLCFMLIQSTVLVYV